MKQTERFRTEINAAYERLRVSGGDLENINDHFGLVRYGTATRHGIEQAQIISVVELDAQVFLIYLLKNPSPSGGFPA